MKIYAVITSLFLIASCVHSSGKSSTVDIDGTWKGEMKSGFGGMSIPITFNFKKVDDSVKGTVSGMPNQWIPLENIEHKGDKISFSVTSDMYGMKSVVRYNGKIKGDRIKMTFKNENPGGSRGKGMRVDMGLGGKSGGGGMAGFMGPQGSLNEFTLDRVSDEPMNPAS